MVHIATRTAQGASGQEIVNFLRSLLEPGQSAQLEAALLRCGYDADGQSLIVTLA